MNFDHRRDWIEQRLFALSDVFAVGLYGYAVMSNHVHVAIHVNPNRAKQWSDEEVARRWCALSSNLYPPEEFDGARELRIQALLGDAHRLAEVRVRLGSLSWFMRYLNEAIARAANREDGCTGRFWEGRFQCKRLEDEAALLGCMAYVDLNPIRAGIASTLADSHHTSIRRRLERCREAPLVLENAVAVLAGKDASCPAMTVRAYFDLVEWTGRRQRADRRGNTIGDATPSCLARLPCNPREWLRLASGLERWFGAAVGSRERLEAFADVTGRHWIRGASTAW